MRTCILEMSPLSADREVDGGVVMVGVVVVRGVTCCGSQALSKL